jgi:hypothetical protein
MKRLLYAAIFLLGMSLYGMGVFIISVAGSPKPATPAGSATRVLSPTTEISVTTIEATTSTKKPIVRAMTRTTATGVGYGGVGAW